MLHFGEILCNTISKVVAGCDEVVGKGEGGNSPINQVGLKTAHSILREEMYFDTCPIIGPSPTSNTLALNNTNLFTPFSTARSINAFIGGKQSIIGGATRKIALM